MNEFTVEVIVDGQPANEYDDDDEPEADAVNTVTKYVVAKFGKEFRFKTTVGRRADWGGADFITAMPEIEGKKYGGKILRPSYLDVNGKCAMEIEGEWSGSGSNAKLYKFTFAQLETRKNQDNAGAFTHSSS